jgi:hypothetical protein
MSADKAKQHYEKWNSWIDQVQPLNGEVAKIVLSYEPKSVFEIRSWLGRHHKLLPEVGYFQHRHQYPNCQACAKSRHARHAGDETIFP